MGDGVWHQHQAFVACGRAQGVIRGGEEQVVAGHRVRP
jgi:hypothetical protein